MAVDLKERFQKAKAVVFTTYTGLTVAEMGELRRHFGKGMQYKVVKTTIAKKASEGTPVEVAGDYFKGQLGIAIGYDDSVTAARKVIEFAKKNEKLKLGVGVLDGRLVSSEDLKGIAALPPRQVLLSMLAGVLQAPIGKLAYGLSATVSRFSNAMNALKAKKG